MMPDHERDEIIAIVKDCIKAEINSRIVTALGWIIGVGLANFAAIVTGIWLFWNVSQSIEATKNNVVRDRWTGSMAVVAELHRQHLNPTYLPIDVRKIQQDNPAQ